MVYDMVKLAGGDLNIANGSNGAQITLRLPLRLAPRLDGSLVLLVEDDAALRTNIREMLTSLGLSVIEASAVDEALSLLRDIPDIALVLSDLNLAGDATGVDLARVINGPALILMTSLPGDDPLHQSARALAPVLRKPFTAQALADLLVPEAAQ